MLSSLSIPALPSVVPPLIVNSSSTTVVFTPCGSTTLPFWKQREQRNEDTNVETVLHVLLHTYMSFLDFRIHIKRGFLSG